VRSEYFIAGTTFPAPIFGESFTRYVQADTPEDALRITVASYGKLGVYSARAFPSADGYHKKQPPLAEWLSNRAQAERKAGTRMFIEWSANGRNCVMRLAGQVVTIRDAKQGAIS
jgi:hypothetical protein